MIRTDCCNKCGKKLDDFDKSSGLSYGRLLGYGSKYDGGYLKINLCTDCLDSLIDSCKIRPVIDRF